MIMIIAGRVELVCLDCGRTIEVFPSEGQLVALTDVVIAENDHITDHIIEGRDVAADRN